MSSALFLVLCTMRLSVALAAPALDEDGCDSTYAGPQRSEDARCANALIKLRLPAAKRTAKRAAVPRRGAPVVWKSSPRSTSLRNLKDFGQLALRDGYFTKQQIAKNSGTSPLTTSQRLPGVAWIISRPARGENAIAEGTKRAPKALQ